MRTQQIPLVDDAFAATMPDTKVREFGRAVTEKALAPAVTDSAMARVRLSARARPLLPLPHRYVARQLKPHPACESYE